MRIETRPLEFVRCFLYISERWTFAFGGSGEVAFQWVRGFSDVDFEVVFPAICGSTCLGRDRGVVVVVGTELG
jgi:hypothetical protein